MIGLFQLARPSFLKQIKYRTLIFCVKECSTTRQLIFQKFFRNAFCATSVILQEIELGVDRRDAANIAAKIYPITKPKFCMPGGAFHIGK
ncbi:hypothetical protein Q666_16820 [Marinobacter sp. ES-1]|nr:hypothetical protein Q666_16820 [Marinobacter sp. ES-1]